MIVTGGVVTISLTVGTLAGYGLARSNSMIAFWLLIFALILKNFSDRQIKLEKQIIEFIVNRIERSYSKISEFIYKVDELSLKKKKPINLKTIKEIL